MCELLLVSPDCLSSSFTKLLPNFCFIIPLLSSQLHGSSMYPSLISVASGPREVLQDFGISGQCPALCRAALISLEPARGPAAWLGTVSSGAAPPVGSQAPASPNPPPPPTSPNVNLWDNLEWGTLFFLEEEPGFASKWVEFAEVILLLHEVAGGWRKGGEKGST